MLLAIVLTCLVIAIAVWVASRGTSDESAETDNQGVLNVAGKNLIGKCLQFEDTQEPTVTKLPIIECGEPHTHEIYLIEKLDAAELGEGQEDQYPGFDALEDIARVLCFTEFSNYTQQDPFESNFFFTWLVPTLASWNDEGINDREVLCLLGPRDSGKTTGSQKQS